MVWVSGVRNRKWEYRYQTKYQPNLWENTDQLFTEFTAPYTLVRILNTNKIQKKYWDLNTKYQIGIGLVSVYQKVGIRLTSLVWVLGRFGDKGHLPS